jgi:hypothetical protein
MAALDVGAQFGYDSLAIANRTRAPVAAFECDPAALVGMRRSFELNPRLAPLIQSVEATVGDGPGELPIDDWVETAGFAPGFIKIDIEGAEIRALRSAERVLRRCRPALIVEVHSLGLEHEAGMLMRRHGYRPRVISQRRVFGDRRPTGHNRWLVAQ